jgi:hypothetical protein
MAKATVSMIIPEIKLERHTLYLIGNAPLIVHAFPEKARKQMLDKQMKQAKGGRDAREPYAEIEAARYRLPDGRDGFPAVGFKAAAVTACTSLADVTKVAARQAFRVEGMPMNAGGIIEGAFVRTALVPLIAHEPTIREDVVRLSGPSRAAEMRYRPEYSVWGVELNIVINPQVISIGQLGSMFQAAGHGVGIGDYRPERQGDCGTFDLVSESEFTGWRKEAGL